MCKIMFGTGKGHVIWNRVLGLAMIVVAIMPQFLRDLENSGYHPARFDYALVGVLTTVVAYLAKSPFDDGKAGCD